MTPSVGTLSIVSATETNQTEKCKTEKWRLLFFCLTFFCLVAEVILKASVDFESTYFQKVVQFQFLFFIPLQYFVIVRST